MNDREKLREIYAILRERGCHPISQIAGYIITEDPTYITNCKGARQLAGTLDRDELLRDMIARYFEVNEDGSI